MAALGDSASASVEADRKEKPSTLSQDDVIAFLESDDDEDYSINKNSSKLKRNHLESTTEEDESGAENGADSSSHQPSDRITRASNKRKIEDSSEKESQSSDDEEANKENKPGEKTGKRRRVVLKDSDDDDAEYEPTNAKSSKDQLRQIKKNRMRHRSDEDLMNMVKGYNEDEDEEEEDDDEDDEDEREMMMADGFGVARPPKYVRPTRQDLKQRCLDFFNKSVDNELVKVPKITLKTTDIIIGMRPFKNFEQLYDEFEDTKGLNSGMISSYLSLLDTECNLERILSECARETFDLNVAVQYLKRQEDERNEEYLIAPTVLTNKDLKLKPYQTLGVRWLNLMYNQKLNAILADEMGLGKTIQIVAFLALLKERKKSGNWLHLIIVPSSTIDNWFTELHRWWPDVQVLNYYGGLEDRQYIRQDVLRRLSKKGKMFVQDEEDKPLDVLLTTYTMITSRPEDRSFLKRLNICYAIFDEAHMLKNCKTKRYKDLTRIRSARKILLTGTPLQNNLVELMSLMCFVMPSLFDKNDTGEIFDMFNTKKGTAYESQKVEQAKEILRPFVLRRLKSQVLKHLPKKNEQIIKCPMPPNQQEVYSKIVEEARKHSALENPDKKRLNWIMQLRKAANHPLLHRHFYTHEKMMEMAEILVKKEEALKMSDVNCVVEDMSVMSDYDIDLEICKTYPSMEPYRLPRSHIFQSGKIQELDRILSDMKSKGKKVLLFSQFVIMMDILAEYLKIRGISYLRLDGSTAVVERQSLIDDFNQIAEISVFLISTRAGGLGINLVSASTCIIHDIDYNPYNDRQAEDRAHRMGQTRDVDVIKLVSKNSVEEDILKTAVAKLNLEQQVTGDIDNNEGPSTSSAGAGSNASASGAGGNGVDRPPSMACLLKDALKL